jgi:hypothetical protein
MPFDAAAMHAAFSAGDNNVIDNSMLPSVDGYVEDKHGRFNFAVTNEEMNLYINQLTSSVSTYLTGEKCTSRWSIEGRRGFARYDFDSYDLGSQTALRACTNVTVHVMSVTEICAQLPCNRPSTNPSESRSSD